MVGMGTMGMGTGMAMGTGNLTHAFTHGTLTCIPAGYTRTCVDPYSHDIPELCMCPYWIMIIEKMT